MLTNMDKSFLSAHSAVTEEFLINFVSGSLSLDTESVSQEEVRLVMNGHTENMSSRTVKTVKGCLDGFLHAARLSEGKEAFTENDWKDIHEKILAGIGHGGLYRNVDISVAGSRHTPPGFIKVYDRMKKYFHVINDESLDPYYRIAFSYLQLVKIHPFLEGNGRLARIVLNCMLLRHHLKPVVFRPEEKDILFSFAEEFKINKNIDSFISFLKNFS